MADLRAMSDYEQLAKDWQNARRSDAQGVSRRDVSGGVSSPAAATGSQVLQGFRALDLTDAEAGLCGKMMADLGVDVIAVEPPGGSPSRLLPPFVDDVPGPDRGIPWLAFSVNKRSVTLDLTHEAGRALFQRLVATSDFVI